MTADGNYDISSNFKRFAVPIGGNFSNASKHDCFSHLKFYSNCLSTVLSKVTSLDDYINGITDWIIYYSFNR